MGLNEVINMTLLDCYFYNKTFFSIKQYITMECLTCEVQFHFTVKNRPFMSNRGNADEELFVCVRILQVQRWVGYAANCLKVNITCLSISPGYFYFLFLEMWQLSSLFSNTEQIAWPFLFFFFSPRRCFICTSLVFVRATCLKWICVTFGHGTVWTDRPSLGPGCRLFV